MLDEDGNYLLDEYGFTIDEGGYSGNGEYLIDPETGEYILDDFGRPIKNDTPVPKRKYQDMY